MHFRGATQQEGHEIFGLGSAAASKVIHTEPRSFNNSALSGWDDDYA